MKILISTLLALIFFTNNVYAHPGRQNPDGGHSCYTNCNEYGLKYGEYHYHNYYNRKQDDKPLVKKEPSTSIPTWVIVSVLIAVGIIYLIIKSPKTDRSPRLHGEIIDITPTKEQTINEDAKQMLNPPDEEVETTGTITKTIYRNRPFFVASFISNDGVMNTIVGNYNERLYTNKSYFIRGTLTYDRRYGKQIKVSYIKKV